MTQAANALLEKLVKEYRATKLTDFPYTFYMDFPDRVLMELKNNGYITQKHNIIGTISLTPLAIQETNN